MTEDYCWGCETPNNCRWCPNNKGRDKCGFCGRELPTEQAVRTGKLWKELADTKKKLDRYEKALEKIAKDRKIISMTGYDFDNEIYVNTAREALGLPLDIPEYDNVE